MNLSEKNFTAKLPSKIVFENGAARKLAPLAKALLPEHVTSVLLVTYGAHLPAHDAICQALEQENLTVSVCDAVTGEPDCDTIDRVAPAIRAAKPGVVIALGGGAVIDMAKALCVVATNEGSVRDYLFGGSRTITRHPTPLIAVPTTAGSGSEVTAASVVDDTVKQTKLSISHEEIIPRYAVIDPSLHLGIPPKVTAYTGMDALTHAIEAYVSKNANPISDAYAEKCIRLVGENLQRAVTDGENLETRSAMALASTLGAAAFLNGGLGAVHGISQSIGGIAHSSHGETNAVMLPYVMAYNLPGATTRLAWIASALGADVAGLPAEQAAACAVEAVRKLSRAIAIPKDLAALGVKAEMFPAIVEGTMGYRLLPLNPVTVTPEAVTAILEAALHQ
ncbi:MAG: iron-containing alcohol dehydrogenase [Oscillospiraceae bacterium]|nr:iron-containing alcohol dehydrogenase [Oscillospiraceae bacterium]